MKNEKPHVEDLLLQSGLEDLHQESTSWLSEIEFWEIELIFFQKLLDKYASHFQNIEDKKKIDQFQNFMTYYSGELLHEIRKELSQHEKFLASQLGSNDHRINEQTYRVDHQTLNQKVTGIRKEIAQEKRNFFEFIQPALDKLDH
jgi:hypothetical protein